MVPSLGDSEVRSVSMLLDRPDVFKARPHLVGFVLQSKGGILSKACDYIQELRQSNHRLSEELQGLDQLQLDNDVLRQQVEDLKNKNLLLRAQLRHHGLEVVIKNDSN